MWLCAGCACLCVYVCLRACVRLCMRVDFIARLFLRGVCTRLCVCVCASVSVYWFDCLFAFAGCACVRVCRVCLCECGVRLILCAGLIACFFLDGVLMCAGLCVRVPVC